MKIAIYHNLPSGGAKRALVEYIKHTSSEHTYDLYRIAGGNEDFLDVRPLVDRVYDYELQDVRIPRWLKGLRMLAPIFNLTKLEQLQKRIAADIDNRNYDLVFAHHCQVTQSPAILKYLHTPSVYYMQEPRRLSFEKQMQPEKKAVLGPISLLRRLQQDKLETMTRAIDGASVSAATIVLCNSYYSAESIYRAYAIEARVSYLGVSAPDFRLGSIERASQVVSVGALHPAKGHDFVIKALGLIAKKRRPKLVIVADRALHGYDQVLRDLARKLDVKLELCEQASDSKLVEIYGSSLVTVCAAHLEPFGFTPIESMACGTPVVAVKEGGYRETVIPNITGLLTDRNPQAFATALELVITQDHNYQPASLRRHVEQYWSWETSANTLNAYFEMVKDL